jgi:hypothetical protein
MNRWQHSGEIMSSTVSHHILVRANTAWEVNLNNFNIILWDVMPCGVLVIISEYEKLAAYIFRVE